MFEYMEIVSGQFGLSPNHVIIGLVAIGAFLAFVGMLAMLRRPNPAAVRIAASSPEARRAARQNRGLLRPMDNGPKGLMKSFVPSDATARTSLQRKLSQAGYPHSGALTKFTMVRIFLGLILPALLVALIVTSQVSGVHLPLGLHKSIATLSSMKIFQLLTILVALGYFGPVFWLNQRVAERRRRIEEGFPNALDLMQISVEAGLGFDAAMTRVGNELVEVSPDIAFEFLSVQTQVQAGRARDVAMQDMADRTGVEVVRSFANVVYQSMQFGTSMASALTTYSQELRKFRELRAEEMANKLPVKMSAVLASLMLPALILITIGPVVIRYIRFYGGG
ncbi:Bacterial type II secretion system protein F domain protein [Roseovarius albus]|uniref:Bacterial type II secretion system protein F domain protein n=1 Tax=Roseovarius albus TaxID=1247867 RepID=A0A1X7AB94_9RHOB|nr:type II secretion system F family protein [Roseovarius albus]SLN73342.1 Bacterial type II secretion system protein F domain protein [Roseovarius albus]